jgi:hypothetical protein
MVFFARLCVVDLTKAKNHGILAGKSFLRKEFAPSNTCHYHPPRKTDAASGAQPDGGFNDTKCPFCVQAGGKRPRGSRSGGTKQKRTARRRWRLPPVRLLPCPPAFAQNVHFVRPKRPRPRRAAA